MSGVSEDFQRDAATTRDAFLALYSPDVAALAAETTRLKPFSESEYLVSYGSGEYLLTSATLYLIAGDNAGTYATDDIVAYEVSARRRRISATLEMRDGRSLSIEDMSKVPSLEANRRSPKAFRATKARQS